jgi:hypothetical protein
LWRALGGFIGSKIKSNQYRETDRIGGRKSTGKKTQIGQEGRRACSESSEEKSRRRRSIPRRRLCLSSISPLTRNKGFAHRELTVTWTVLVHNLWVLARLPQAQAPAAKRLAA